MNLIKGGRCGFTGDHETCGEKSADEKYGRVPARRHGVGGTPHS